MADTVETLGDAVLTRRLIDRSITEYVDSTITKIGKYAFAKCDQLKKIVCPNVISIVQNDLFENMSSLEEVKMASMGKVPRFKGSQNLRKVTFQNASYTVPSAFHGCTSLEDVQLPKIYNLGQYAFCGCTALKKLDLHNCYALDQNDSYGYLPFDGADNLEALILRMAGVCHVYKDSSFDGPIKSGKCYVYVPADYVDAYKADSMWSTYANQIRAIEDYPEVCDPYNWEAVFKTLEAGTYKDFYKIGDLVPLDLGSKGTVNMQIAAFDTDDLADGSGKAPITWVSDRTTGEYIRANPALVTNDDGTYQEGTGNIGGWEKSAFRAYLNDTIKPLIPETVRSNIKEVTKSQLATSTAGAQFTQTTTDDVWVLDFNEVGNSTSIYGKLFPDKDSLKNKGGNFGWWMRSVYQYDLSRWRSCGSSGHIGYTDSASTQKVRLCFCT